MHETWDVTAFPIDLLTDLPLRELGAPSAADLNLLGNQESFCFGPDEPDPEHDAQAVEQGSNVVPFRPRAAVGSCSVSESRR